MLTEMLASVPQRRPRRVPDRPRQHCADNALVKGSLGEQGLLCQPRRRRRPPAQGALLLGEQGPVALARGAGPERDLECLSRSLIPGASLSARLAQGSTDLDHIQIIKKVGGKLTDSYLDEGFILEKSIAVNSPKRIENAKIMIGNTCGSSFVRCITCATGRADMSRDL